MTNKQSKNWLITINNPSTDAKSTIQFVQQLGFTWGAAQLERGEQGTEHIQAAFGGKQFRFDSLKKLFPGAHIESAKHPRRAYEYCSKEDTRVGENHKFGEPPLLRNNKSDVKELNR